MTEAWLDPGRTALMLMDLQPALLERVGAPDDLVPRAQTVLSWGRAAGLHVGHVVIALTGEDYEAIPETNAFLYAMRDTTFLTHGTPDADYRIVVLSDVVMDPRPAVNRLLLEEVIPGQAQVMTSEELRALDG